MAAMAHYFDCRWFAGFYTIASLLIILLTDDSLTLVFVVMPIMAAILVLLVHPYKKEYGVSKCKFSIVAYIFLCSFVHADLS